MNLYRNRIQGDPVCYSTKGLQLGDHKRPIASAGRVLAAQEEKNPLQGCSGLNSFTEHCKMQWMLPDVNTKCSISPFFLYTRMSLYRIKFTQEF